MSSQFQAPHSVYSSPMGVSGSGSHSILSESVLLLLWTLILASQPPGPHASEHPVSYPAPFNNALYCLNEQVLLSVVCNQEP